MTTTILTSIGIVLAGIAALMSVYYGGEAFREGSVKAEAAQVMNAYQNIRATVGMLERERRGRLSHADVMSRMRGLPEAPGGGIWSTNLDDAGAGTRFASVAVTPKVCTRINEVMGVPQGAARGGPARAGCDASGEVPEFYGSI